MRLAVTLVANRRRVLPNPPTVQTPDTGFPFPRFPQNVELEEQVELG